jgi:4-diphosphocytidyl-2C-methyl-D-erythritol kinase
MSHFPEAQNGNPGRAEKLAALLATSDLTTASKEFYNSLEAPALKKYPLLIVFQNFFRENGAITTLMSGSGSATFAIVDSQPAAEKILEKFKIQFGNKMWVAAVPLN